MRREDNHKFVIFSEANDLGCARRPSKTGVPFGMSK